jgi:hypothetical protein
VFFVGHGVFPYTNPDNNVILLIKWKISSIYITLLDGITIPVNNRVMCPWSWDMKDINPAEYFEKLLDPNLLQANLLLAALFTLSYEFVEDRIVDGILEFYCMTIELAKVDRRSDDYQRYKSEVLSLDKKPVFASLLWLENSNAISRDDIEAFENIRAHRNEIVHELIDYISDPSKQIRLQLLTNLIDLFEKIQKWWAIAVWIPCDPYYDNKDVDPTDVEPMSVSLLKNILTIALGEEEERGQMLREFRDFVKAHTNKRHGSQQAGPVR